MNETTTQPVMTGNTKCQMTNQESKMRYEFEAWHNKRAEGLLAKIEDTAAEFIADGFQDSPATKQAAMFHVLARVDETGWEAWQAALAQHAEQRVVTDEDVRYALRTYTNASHYSAMNYGSEQMAIMRYTLVGYEARKVAQTKDIK